LAVGGRSSVAEIVNLLACHSINEGLRLLVSSAPNPGQIRQVVLFEAPDQSGPLRSLGSIGLSVNEGRIYEELSADIPLPITICHRSASENPVIDTLENSISNFPAWAPYVDEDLKQWEVLNGHVVVWPLAALGVRVGVLYVLLVGTDVDEVRNYLQRLLLPLGALVAIWGYCRMWDPSLVGGRKRSGLSLLDKQILLFVEDGLTNQQIATQLSAGQRNVSESKVRNSLTDIYKNLGASNRHDAANKARLWGDLTGLR
jgi:DNA-binding CsgD family transcriptional regulator